ncbi:hypothetical protein AB3N04_01000 (plasmid) [Alkalihalophilus sp. As8PL]|uniref:Uncharacterized protein n=1 Tax=Alkalihalophilus sp. As8PL TaxID=3237103 RepID=A0AB39BMW6_9BACI
MSNQKGSADEVTLQEDEQKPLFVTDEELLSFWDDPTVVGGINFPPHYKPMTHIVPIYDKMKTGFINEEAFTIMKVVGDGIATNEEQIKRFFLTKNLTRTEVSNHINRLREKGFLDRWHLRSDVSEHVYPNLSAPITLGMSGFILLKHFYKEQFFMDSMLWDRLGIHTIQRYIAANELRCQIYESRTLRKWVWNGLVANNTKISRPFGTAVLSTPNGDMKFVFERVHQGKKYLTHLTKRINQWGELIEDNNGTLPVANTEELRTIVVVYVSTRSLAEHIVEELALFNVKFMIWICIEEDLIKFGIEHSFYIPEKHKLKPVKMAFLAPKR